MTPQSSEERHDQEPITQTTIFIGYLFGDGLDKADGSKAHLKDYIERTVAELNFFVLFCETGLETKSEERFYQWSTTIGVR